MKNPYIDILRILSKKGISVDYDITNELNDHFENKTLADIWYNNRSIDIETLLDSMQNSGHIKYTTTQKNPNKTPLKDEYKAQITPSGDVFYREHKSNKWNCIKSWIALLIAAASAIFTGWGVINKHNSKPEETKSPPPISNTKFHRK